MKKEITIKADAVLEARPLAEMVGIANGFLSRIMLHMDGRMANAKSIMGIMGLGLDLNKKVVIDAEGADEEDAIRRLEEFLTKL